MKALILIDIQKGFDNHDHWGGTRNNPQMEENALSLLVYWREQGWPIAHVRHDSLESGSPLSPGQSGNNFKEGFEPKDGEALFPKNVNSGFIGTKLEEYLRSVGANSVVICGISTEHCVYTTTRMAGNLGFDTELVEDACHAWPHGGFDAQTIHDTQLAVLSNEFATIRKTQEIISKL